MAIKLADTARPNNYVDTEHPGTFPVAYAEDVWFADGTRLSEKTFDGQSVQKEELPLASATEEGNIYQYIGVNGTYTNGYFYKCVEDSGSYSWVNIQVQDAGAETIVDVNSVPVSGISNVIYRTTDLSGDASYYAGNETASNTDQLAKYSDIQIIQVETLETANSTLEGTIVQYIGATGNGLYNGYFYKCVEVETSQYEWVAWNVQEDNAVPHWSGTRAEYEAIKDTLETGTYVSITDDYDEGLEVVDVIEENNMNPVTSNAVATVAKMCKCVSVGSLPDKVIPTTGTVITQLTLPKGKWMVFGQLHTNGFSTANQLLTLAISVNGSAASGETVDQKVQAPGYWVFVHGMLLFEPTTEVTVKLVAVATEQITGVVKAEMIAIPVE